MMSVTDKNNLTVEKLDWVRAPFPAEFAHALPTEKAAVVRVIGIDDDLRRTTLKGAFITALGTKITFSFEPSVCELVAKANGLLVAAAKTLPVVGEVK